MKSRTIVIGSVLALAAFFLFPLSSAAPQGARISDNATASQPTSPPDNRTDDGGTINTLILDSTQQNNEWKAYVGNVTGKLTLDDGSGNSIYDWSLDDTNIEGEVYVSRNTSITWGNVSCASQSTITAEEEALNINSTDSDSINNTFNATNHSSMQVGAEPISADSCRATATYVDDSSQTVNKNATFQEILLEDEDTKLVYSTFIEQDADSYIDSAGSTFDFQLIVGEDKSTSSPTPYNFYLEIT